jgi:hypothetical protein
MQNASSRDMFLKELMVFNLQILTVSARALHCERNDSERSNRNGGPEMARRSHFFGGTGFSL